MRGVWTLPGLDIENMAGIAALLSLKVRAGDVIALNGDLGAGKTTLARALIRAIAGDDTLEVASPSFPILIGYETGRVAIAHFDFYRLGGAGDLEETGFAEAVAQGMAIVEWAERVEAAGEDTLGGDRLDIDIGPGSEPDLRDVVIRAGGTWRDRLDRLVALDAFLQAALGDRPQRPIRYLQGDASSRAYARVGGARPLVLMDSPRMADGPIVRNGLPYSRIAHLAEDVGPFVAIGRALERQGASVPHIEAVDADRGFLLLEDLGDHAFGVELAAGTPQEPMWRGAVDVLLALRADPPRDFVLPDGRPYVLPRFDRAALEIEVGLLLDWYWPAAKGEPPSPAVRAAFEALWSPLIDRMLSAPPGLFLRDYHSPNLFWLPDRPGVRRVGLIDFQDALAEPWAYDLVSVLQDARVDVPADLEEREKARYAARMQTVDPGFDAAGFEADYALFGAQRNTRLVGLWVRLLKRDGKPNYMRHMPRTWDYLARNLRHPSLAPLQAWYERHLPEDVRNRPLQA